MKTLIVDPDPESRDALRRAFFAQGAQVRGVASLAEGRKQLAELLSDVVVIGLDGSADDAWSFLEETIVSDPRRAVYGLVSSDRLELGVQAVTRGAEDFLWRPVSELRVAILIARLVERRESGARAEELRIELARREAASSLPGTSVPWKATLASLEREAANDCAVLLAGEAGTEKEAAARTLHRLSRRGAEDFRSVPEGRDLATALASPGTLFVAGIERAPRAVQETLVGEIEKARSPRLIVASDEDPRQAVAAGHLVGDLLEAFADHFVHLPPLRERGGDIELLARRFLSQIDPVLFFDAEAMDALSAHDWPGNVRELEEVVRRASQLADRSSIGPTVVLSVLSGSAPKRRPRRRKPPVVHVPVGASLADVERRLIQKTLEFVRGNKPRAAQLLKLSLKTIYNKIKEYGLEH
jgi:DNA-binding NtrC family response regulator